jgi:hypothetical protein
LFCRRAGIQGAAVDNPPFVLKITVFPAVMWFALWDEWI